MDWDPTPFYEDERWAQQVRTPESRQVAKMALFENYMRSDSRRMAAWSSLQPRDQRSMFEAFGARLEEEHPQAWGIGNPPRPKGGVGMNVAVGVARGGTTLPMAAAGTTVAAGELWSSAERAMRKMVDPVVSRMPEWYRKAHGEAPVLGDTVAEVGRRAFNYFRNNLAVMEQEYPQGNVVDDPGVMKDVRFWAQAVPEAAVSMASGIALGGGTALGGAIAGGVMEAAPSYVQMREEGMPAYEARARAAAFGVGVAALEKIGLEKVLKGKAPGALRKILAGALAEASTEWGEEPWEALTQNLARQGVTWSDMGERIKSAAKQGMAVIPATLVTGGLITGTRVATEPRFTSADDVEVAAVETYGPEAVTRTDDGRTVVVHTPTGVPLVFKFVQSPQELTGTQSGEATLLSMEGSANGETQAVAAKALATARQRAARGPGGRIVTEAQIREEAGQALIKQGWARTAQTQYLPDLVDPTDPNRTLPSAVVVELVEGRATAGTLAEEDLHALAMLSGNQLRGGRVVDPSTGATLKEEALADALATGADHPVVRKIKDFALRVVATFRRNASESLYDTAKRVRGAWQAQVTSGKATPGPASQLTEQEATALDEKQKAAAAAFDARITDRTIEGQSVVLAGPEPRPSSGMLLDAAGRPIPGTAVPVRGQGKVPGMPGEQVTVKTPQGETALTGRTLALEADQLLTSDQSGFPQELQPRNRNTLASAAQVAQIRADPDPSRLLDSPGPDVGAPWVVATGQQNARGAPMYIVISGNARTRGVREGYQAGTTAPYERAARDRLRALGHREVDFMQRPMMAYELLDSGGKTLPEVAEFANRDRTLQRSEAELAEAEGKVLTEKGLLQAFSPDESGRIRAASNRDFLNAFVAATGETSLQDSKGEFTAAVEPRVRRAVLAAVLQGHPQAREILTTLIEQSEAWSIQNQRNGVMQAAGALSKAALKNPSLDLRPDLAQSLADLVDFRQQQEAGKIRTLEDYLAQGELFERGRTPESMALLRLLAEAKSGKQISDALMEYAAKAEKVDTTTGSMFSEELAEPEKAALLQISLEKKNAQETRYSVARASGQWSDAKRTRLIVKGTSLRIWEANRNGSTLFETQVRDGNTWRTVQYASTEPEAQALERWDSSNLTATELLNHSRRQPWYRRAKQRGLSDREIFGFNPEIEQLLITDEASDSTIVYKPISGPVEMAADTRYQVRRVQSRTIPRLESSAEYAEILKGMSEQPEAYHERQNLKGMIQARQARSADALLASAEAQAVLSLGDMDSARNGGMMDLIVAMEKLREAGEADRVREIARQLAKSATTAAQMVRQMGVLPGMRAERVVEMVRTTAEEHGGTLSSGNETIIYNLAQADIAAQQAVVAAEQEFLAAPREATARLLDAQRAVAEKTSRKLLLKLGDVAPKGWGEIIRGLIQGNVLTPISLVANVTGNVVNMPMRAVADTIGATTEGLLHAMGLVKTRTLGQPLADAWAWAGGFARGGKSIPRILATGLAPEAVRPGGEVHRSFQPLRAALKLAMERGSAPREWTYGTLPGTPAPGANQRAKWAVEATLAAPAELMFRALSAGDVPFYTAAYQKSLNEIARLRRLKGKARQTFLKAPDAEAVALATERALIDIYQGNAGELASAAMKVANWKPGEKIIGAPAADILNAIAVRPVFLFVRTPVNIMAEAHGFLNPAYSAVKMAAHARAAYAEGRRNRGQVTAAQIRHQREAFRALGRTVAGIGLWTAINALVTAGLLAGRGGRSKREQELARLTLKPWHFNKSGLERWLRGEDPSWREGDVQVDYRSLGIVGLAMNIAATGDEIQRSLAAQRGERYEPGAVAVLERALSAGPALGTAMLELSMMKGAYTFLDALRSGRPENWLVQWAETVSAAPMPNTLKNLSRLTLDTWPETEEQALKANERTKWQSWAKELGNRIQTKLHVVRWAVAKSRGEPAPRHVAGLTERMDLFGRTVPMTPEGENPITWHLVDTLKAEAIPFDRYAAEVRRVFDATNNREVIPSKPGRTLTVDGKTIRLTPQQHQRYTQLRGALVRWMLDNALKTRRYQDSSDQEKAWFLEAVNRDAEERSTRIFRAEEGLR